MNLSAAMVHETKGFANKCASGGEPRFMTPYFPFMNENYDPESLPLMFYVPGIDGTGLGAYRQLENIAKGFQLESFFIPIADKQDFRSLLKIFTVISPKHDIFKFL